MTFRSLHTAEISAQTLTTTVIGYVAVIEINLDLPDHVRDGCQTVNGGCPIPVGDIRDIGSTFIVRSPLSNINPAIEYRVTTETGAVFICVRTNIQLVG